MGEDTWGRWAVVGIVASLLGWAVSLVAEQATISPERPVFLGIMTGVAFVIVALRR